MCLNSDNVFEISHGKKEWISVKKKLSKMKVQMFNKLFLTYNQHFFFNDDSALRFQRKSKFLNPRIKYILSANDPRYINTTYYTRVYQTYVNFLLYKM